MTSRPQRIGGIPLLAVTLALGAVLLLGLAPGSSTAPAASTCEVSLKSSSARPYVNTSVTLTARATNCDPITKIVADTAISGVRSFPCSSGAACTILVTAPKALLVHFTAEATKNGKTVKSNRITVKWAKTKPRAPSKFTMTIKNSSGKVVWKGVQDLTTGRTTYPVGNPSPTLPGGSKVTLSASWDLPISRGGEVRIDESVWDLGQYGASHTKTACRTATPGKSGCSITRTLKKRDTAHGHETQHFQGNGRTAAKGYGGFMNVFITLGAPKS